MSMIWSVLSVAVQLHKGNSCWNITGGLPMSPSIYHTQTQWPAQLGEIGHNKDICKMASDTQPHWCVMSSSLGGWWVCCCDVLFSKVHPTPAVFFVHGLARKWEAMFKSLLFEDEFLMLHLCLIEGWPRPSIVNVILFIHLHVSDCVFVCISEGILDLQKMSLQFMCVYILSLNAPISNRWS